MVGTRLGSYEIIAAIGAGGMGEVFRAKDTRLGRDVAIKVLPSSYAADPDRLARFQREAQVLAALNHPHIAAIYGLEEADGVRALVLELVEGETLADRIARGPLPVDEATAIARQIAEALEAAHEQGIVHRDLKPANIKVNPDGRVKVLDFGLAKLTESPAAASNASSLSMSPTITTPAMTQMGMILGTAAYMSPEQAKGRPADKRSDVWAFGCVLYEMLAGKRALEGDDVSETLASVLKSEPDWSALPSSVPDALRSFMKQCVAKDRAARVGDLSTFRFVLQSNLQQQAAPVTGRHPGWWIAGGTIAALFLIALVGVASLWIRPELPKPLVWLTIPFGANEQIADPFLTLVALSSDGKSLVYTANRQLFLRRLAEGEARPIPGAEVTTSNGGNAVFCAGDTAIVYWIRIGAPNNSGMIAGELRRISPTGGSAVKLATIDSVPLGLRCQDDAVLFGTAAGGIYSVALSTGKQEEVVRRTPGEVTQGPQLLPGGERVLFTVTKRAESAPLPTMQAWNSAHVVVQSRTSGERTTIVAGGADARYLPTGHLVYALNDTLYAAPFDADTLKLGTATPVLDRVARGVAGVLASGAAQWTLSGDGTMAFLPGTGMMADDLRELAIVTEAGAGTPLKLPPAGYETPRFSPDGNAVAYVVRANNDAVVATYPLRGDAVPTQLTFTGQARNPIWSSDGASVIFQWDRDGNRGLWRHRADGTGRPERLTTAAKESAHIPVGIVGTTLMFIEVAEGGQSLWIKGGTEAPRLFGGVRVPANISAAMAADGKWVAYTAPSSASISQVLMQPVPETGEIRAVSSGGRVRWPPGGNRIYYVRTNDVFASDVSKLPTVGVANHVPKVGSVVGLAGVNFDVSADGRFIVVASPGQTDAAGSETPHIQVLLNWLDELKRLVPTN